MPAAPAMSSAFSNIGAPAASICAIHCALCSSVPIIECRIGIEDWLQVERSLDGRLRLRDRAHLTLLAGQLTFFLARLSFHMGAYAAARKHAVLAWQYAEDVEQPVLCASVRVLQNTIAEVGCSMSSTRPNAAILWARGTM